MTDFPARLTDKKRVLVTAAINLAVLLVCAFFLCPTLENNDDFIIHTLTAGGYGESTPILYYINILWARLLTAVQGAFPSVNVFAVIQYFFLYASFTSLGCALWLTRRDALGFSLSLASSLALAPQFYDSMHYTKYAVFFASAATVTLLFSSKGKLSKLALIAGGAIALYSSALRISAFLAGAAMVFAAGAFEALYDGERPRLKGLFKRNKSLIATFAPLFVVIIALFGYHQYFYKTDADAKRFGDYLEARVSVSDYDLAGYYDRQAEYDALGISENDLEIIRTWSFADYEKFDNDTLRAVSGLKDQATLSGVASRFINSIITLDFKSVSFYCAAAMFALCMALCKKRGRLQAACLVFVYYAATFGLCFTGRTTRWVTVGMLTGLCAGLMYTLSRFAEGTKKPKSAAAVICIASLVCFIALNIGNVESYKDHFNPAAKSAYEELNAEDGNLYIYNLETMPSLEWGVPTFSALPNGIYRNLYSLGGWDSQSPVKNDVLKRYGAEGSPYEALLARDNAFLIDGVYLKSKIKFINENYSATARCSIYDVKSGRYVLAFADNFARAEDAEKLEITSFDSAPFETDAAYTRYYVFAACGVENVECAYLEFADARDASAAPMTYRASIITNENGELGVIATVPAIDFTGFDYSVKIVVKTGDSTVYRSVSAEEFSL